ncbi:hypothetical protein WME99_08310 [Sorangium sp. So ce136]|uniref:hypothetical protein n=1 Tax=Sorangium sp. So ce136 TaxID=3133284 RepID=UPI003EFF2545
MPAPVSPSFELTSSRVAQRHPGLGRVLEGLALLSSVGPLLAGALAAFLGQKLASPLFDQLARDILAWSGSGFLAGIFFVLVSVLVASTFTFAPLTRRGTVRVAADAAGLRLTRGAATRWIPRAAIRSGLVVPEPRFHVALELRGGRQLEVHVESEEEGARMLAALGLGPEARRVVVSLGNAKRDRVAGWARLLVCALVVGFASDWFDDLSVFVDRSALSKAKHLALYVLTIWLGRRAARPERIVVGSDGVLVERPFSRTWLPYAVLTAIRTRGDRLLLVRQGDDHPVELRATEQGLARAVARRIREARKRAAGGAAPRGVEALERRGRDPAAWREDLRKMLTAGDYRAAGLALEDVRHALDDASAPPDRRIGAALALRIAGYPEARDLIRVAAEATADDELRAALERAAEDELDEASPSRTVRGAPRGARVR